MPKSFAISVLAAALALPMLSTGFAPPAQQPQPPSDAELQARADKLIANQHRNEQFLDEYERIERQVDQTAGVTPKVLEDRTYRIVPTGTGTMKILVSDRGKPVDPAEYRKQLQLWEQTLELALKPNDSRAKTAYAKFEKKKKDRAELINSMREGLLRKWIGQETINGHLCDVIQLDPNPEFHPALHAPGSNHACDRENLGGPCREPACPGRGPRGSRHLVRRRHPRQTLSRRRFRLRSIRSCSWRLASHSLSIRLHREKVSVHF